jgi:hypothetical protein
MVNATGMDGVSKPGVTSQAPPAFVPHTQREAAAAQDSDRVQLSTQAQAVSQAIRAFRKEQAQQAQEQKERVARARELVAEGNHRLQEVIWQVASRLTNYIPEN